MEMTESTHPVGILAVTSTFPYLILALPFVVSLELMTGLIIVPKLELLTAPHWDTFEEVHVPSIVKLRVYPLVIASTPRWSDVKVGTRYKVSSET
jgi:hypothetical protein